MEVRELKDRAAAQFSKGRFEKAAADYEALCRLEPGDFLLRVRLGDSYMKQGADAEAIAAYRIAAEGYAKQGLLLRAIAVCKVILQLDAGDVSTLRTLAQLYAKRSGPPAVSPEHPAESGASTKKDARDAAAHQTDGPSGARSDAPGGASGPEDAGARASVTPMSAAPPEERSAGALAEAAAVTSEVPGRGAPGPLAASGALAPAGSDAASSTPLASGAEPVASTSIELELGEDDALYDGAPVPAATGLAGFSLADVDLGEPELVGLEPVAGPGASTSTAAEAPAGEGAWFAPPAEPGSGPEVLRLDQLGIADIDEDLDIEILTVHDDLPAEARGLPEIPLFSDLSRQAFVELASRCVLRRPNAGEVVVQEGSPGTSFFVVSGGAFKVCKGSGPGALVLARLTEGAFFGEMALLSGAPRSASVVAEEGAECLEISAPLLAGLRKRHPHVGQVLKKFMRQRLVANVMATSALFRPFTRAERKVLVEKFKARELRPDEAVLVEGRETDGLYVVMAGELRVSKLHEGEATSLARLREGDLFGETSLLSKSVATATVTARTRATVLRLPRADFDELISTHPQVLALVSELSDERLQLQEAIAAGILRADDPGLMLV